MSISSRDANALNRLEKYGEFIRAPDGSFESAMCRTSIDAGQIGRLERLGCCRVETVGQTTLATFLRRP